MIPRCDHGVLFTDWCKDCDGKATPEELASQTPPTTTLKADDSKADV